jgi:CHASE3 domain sensor protein
MKLLKLLALADAVVTVIAMALVYNALHRDLVSERLMVRSIRALRASDETLRLVIQARAAEQEYLRSEDPAVLASLERTEAEIVSTAAELTALLREDDKNAEADRLRAQIAATRGALGSIVDQTLAEGAPGPGQSVRQSASLSMWALLATTQSVSHSETEVLRARIDANQASGRWLSGVALVMTAVGTALLTMFVSGMLFLLRPGWGPRRAGLS